MSIIEELRQASIKKPLYGYDKETNAYLVEDYPYGFRLRTSIRYWLEKKAGKGFRFVAQTLNPKTNKWNKPKASTYADIAACLYLDEKGHVQWEAIGAYTDPDKVLTFIKTFPHADFVTLKVWVAKKIKYLEKMISGELFMTVNDKKVTTDQDIEEFKKEIEEWKECAKALHLTV